MNGEAGQPHYRAGNPAGHDAGKNEEDENKNQFSFRELELAFSSAVDPYGRAGFFVAMEEEPDGESRGLMYVGHLKNSFDLTSDSSLEVGGDHVNVSAISTGKVSRTMGDVHPLGNPPYRLDPYNGRIIARNIARRLKQLDAGHSADYDRDLTAFLLRLDSASRKQTTTSP